MEQLESRALDTAPTPPTMWYRYVDDTMAKIQENAIDSFSEHLHSIDQHIQFTSEQEKDGRISFLDTCVSIKQDGSTKISVYRKPTHTDQYLNFQSNHHLQHKELWLTPWCWELRPWLRKAMTELEKHSTSSKLWKWITIQNGC